MGQEHVSSAKGLSGSITILDSVKLPKNSSDISFAVRYLIAMPVVDLRAETDIGRN